MRDLVEEVKKYLFESIILSCICMTYLYKYPTHLLLILLGLIIYYFCGFLIKKETSVIIKRIITRSLGLSSILFVSSIEIITVRVIIMLYKYITNQPLTY